jgi:hypothetical protein
MRLHRPLCSPFTSSLAPWPSKGFAVQRLDYESRPILCFSASRWVATRRCSRGRGVLGALEGPKQPRCWVLCMSLEG